MTFFVRIRQRARRDLVAGFDAMVAWSGVRVADEWDEGFITALMSLAKNPRAWPLCPELESKRGIEIRQLWYRRTPRGPAWRAIFAIDDETGTVDVLHLRHGARKPLTRKEGREIAGEAKTEP